MEQYKPLKGVKVVELSLMVASASCGRMMADWGADVIKLENTKGGDNFRKWPLSIGAPADDDFDPIFDNLNANKRAVSIDTRTKEGQEIVYRLLEDADVFLTNLRTEALRKQGLDYDTLKEKFPKLVMIWSGPYPFTCSIASALSLPNTTATNFSPDFSANIRPGFNSSRPTLFVFPSSVSMNTQIFLFVNSLIVLTPLR